MSVYNFISQDEIDDLDEDPRNAFMQFCSKVLQTLDGKSEKIDTNSEDEWRVLNELRFSCMNIILAAATRFDIVQFQALELPARHNFNDADWFNFRHEVDHYVTQIVLDNAPRNRSGSVAMLPRTKEQIRTYIAGLRRCIEEATMDEGKREALLKKLDALEKELEKRRVNMMTVALIAYAVWQVPNDVWGSYDVMNKLLSNVMHTVAEAKAEEDQIKQIAPMDAPKALTPPKKATPRDDWARPRATGSTETDWASAGDEDPAF
ncbi:hypothetical protein [Novosphingobium sp. 9]|uniref:hypothetical protein n=1 Tax=Novosphingobium sp. 9 TaxID=2025349 RepID=UPI0021B68C90|nr:hypothetical protein [Novosphingobium sp. 9]